MAQGRIDIGLLVHVLGNNSCQLPGDGLLSRLLLVADRQDLAEQVECSGTIDATSLRELCLQVQEVVVVLEDMEVLRVEQLIRSRLPRRDLVLAQVSRLGRLRLVFHALGVL